MTAAVFWSFSCRALTASFVRTDIIDRLIASPGPPYSPDLTILFLGANATAREIQSVVSDRRFAADSTSYSRAVGNSPDGWSFLTGQETIDQARYEEGEQWKGRIRSLLTRN